MSKTRVLMNYDFARRWPFGVIVEGPMDVCRVGAPQGQDLAGPAVSVFGHTMSPEQIQLARQAWGDKAIVLILDPDAAEAQAALAARLRMEFRKVVSVTLKKDPGDSPHLEIWESIRRQSQRI